MKYRKIKVPNTKRIALVAHDERKEDMLQWAKFNKTKLKAHKLYATGTTGTMLEEELGLSITKLKSGPLGGDLELGAMISKGEIDVLIFLWDPMNTHPHEPDVKALIRMSTLENIFAACDRTTADAIMSSPLMDEDYVRIVRNYEDYENRLK